MNEAQAIYQFMNSFDIPAYASTAVPEDATLPYITYSFDVASLYAGDQLLEINVWYKTESEAVPNAKAREIWQSVPRNLSFDNGAIFVKRGDPTSFPVPQDDNTVKCRRVNLLLNFNSNV